MSQYNKNLKLDSTKLPYYPGRVRKWLEGKRVSPITVDMSLTRACNYKCVYCYGKLQDNKTTGHLKWDVLQRFLDDCRELGVRGVSMVSDGESTCHPCYDQFIVHGHRLGLSMALGTHGANFDDRQLRTILPCLTYLRFNVSAGLPYNYARIHGVAPKLFYKVCGNILSAVELRNSMSSKCTIGMQMVLTPDNAESILSLSYMAVDLGVDYLQIKHCSDDEAGSLGIDYSQYPKMYDTLRRAEDMSNETTKIVIKWNKITEGNKRDYKECYGAPFHIQLSGTGLLAPCGMLFNDKYAEYHIGNIKETPFSELVTSDRYWEVMGKLATCFDARKSCGCLCLQHEHNKYLHALRRRGDSLPAAEAGELPDHIAFI